MTSYSSNINFLIKCVLLITVFVYISNGIKHNDNFRLKAVNLGGWLVTEGWITPYLFDDIENKDLLDGTSITLKSVTTGKYLGAESGGGTSIVVKNSTASQNEKFKLWRINATTFNLRVFHKQFIGVSEFGCVMAVSNISGSSEMFTIVRDTENITRVRIKASNGFFLRAKPMGLVMADSFEGSEWTDDDPSVFLLNVTWKLHGDFQLANGYGPIKAARVLNEHYKTYIVEDDFKLIANNGLNGVRIPVGWWIAYDSNPPFPYVPGSLKALDNAFTWAEKYGLKVVVDLHAVNGGVAHFEHCGTRDGSVEWGKTQQSVQQTVDVVEFLTKRYAKNQSLYAVQLLNEPIVTSGVPIDTLAIYYKAGYQAVRKYSQAYVILSPRIGPANYGFELLSLASTMEGCVLDLHFYNLFFPEFVNMTVQQNIDIINVNRTRELDEFTLSHGPLIFIGEWAIDWYYKGGTKEDYQRFANVSLEVYEKANFGWAFWNYKSVENKYMDLQWLMSNDYIKLKS